MRDRSGVMKWSVVAFAALGATAAVNACGSDTQPSEPPPTPEPTLTGDALLDPDRCAACHADHVRKWSGSMHAYAAEDPVFLAMNRRMQRETNGQNKDFCIKCHAPMALRTGRTTDGLNLAELPSYLRGVTCFFCHSVDAVEGTHDNPLRLADDGVMRGGLRDPSSKAPHRAAYSELHDRDSPSSAALCGSCHDVVSPPGAPIERTFLEWQASLYAKPGQLTCGKCHMEGREGTAATLPGLAVRRVHDHSFPAVDLALTDFPELDAQRAGVQKQLDATLLAKLCVQPSPQGPLAVVTLDNAFVGHGFPSGATPDRRAWVELVATREGAVVFSSGVVEDKKAVTSLDDANLWLLRDRIFDGSNREVHMFWEAARYESVQLPAAVTADPKDPAFFHSVTKTYVMPTQMPDRVTLRVRMRPVDFDVIDDLVASGDLDPSVGDRIPTFDLGSTVKEWTNAAGYGCVGEAVAKP